ncbi:hypothetical protein CUMW_248020 [Citrus unshiu]|uniref:Ubiquitin-like protease family profile domain-containing protein n=1 Tax=Citrus unshiu TaxID=55188 RepID=A0A2H5QP00_CITUN|nr:hypothetical protein CUMW_248020 [Citrus unshiu]
MCISNYILSAFKIFVAKMGNADRKSFVWKKVKCPQQTTNVECGYYVISLLDETVAPKRILMNTMTLRGKSINLWCLDLKNGRGIWIMETHKSLEELPTLDPTLVLNG